jgi:hypothetical protein
MIVSPSLASMSGPGYCPFTAYTSREYPSGAVSQRGRKHRHIPPPTALRGGVKLVIDQLVKVVCSLLEVPPEFACRLIDPSVPPQCAFVVCVRMHSPDSRGRSLSGM